MRPALVVLCALTACGKFEPWRESIMIWGDEAALDNARAKHKPALVLYCERGKPECADEIPFGHRRLRMTLEREVVPVRIAVGNAETAWYSDPQWATVAALRASRSPTFIVLDAKGVEVRRFVGHAEPEALMNAIEAAR